MNHTITKSSVETLLKTWMICEATVHLQDSLRHGSKQIYHQFKTCAASCFDLARTLMEGSVNVLDEQPIACMIECMTCADICRQYADIPEIAFCGTLCESCYSSLMNINMMHQLN